MPGKQAKIMADTQLKLALAACDTSRYPKRDRVMVMLSFKAGLRALEIAGITWEMLCGPDGQLGDEIHLEDRISKKGNGRIIPMHPDLKEALLDLGPGSGQVILSERGNETIPMCAASVVNFFAKLYGKLGLQGCSSHSGRRTFITKASRRAATVGASLRDVQQMAGHKNLNTTQRYIEGDSEAKRKLVNIV
jgi:integrase/recombinase XerD